MGKRKKPWRTLAKQQNFEFDLGTISSVFDKKLATLKLFDHRNPEGVLLRLSNGYTLQADRTTNILHVTQRPQLTRQYRLNLTHENCDFFVTNEGKGIGTGDIRDIRTNSSYPEIDFDLFEDPLNLLRDPNYERLMMQRPYRLPRNP